MAQKIHFFPRDFASWREKKQFPAESLIRQVSHQFTAHGSSVMNDQAAHGGIDNNFGVHLTGSLFLNLTLRQSP